jgi:hypothetical protein
MEAEPETSQRLAGIDSGSASRIGWVVRASSMRCRFSVVWLTVFAVWLTAVAATAADDGERFVTPSMPDPAAWELVRDPSRPAAQVWKNKQNERDQLRIEAFPGSRDGLAEVRMTLDGPGKASCSSFDTTTLRDTPVYGYPRLFWRTDCTRADGARSTLLNLVIRGRDGLYLAMKIWQFDVDDSEVDGWIERFERYFVCDPRTANQACPADVGRAD